MSAIEHTLAMTTVADETEARDLARALVESGLAACVNRVPVFSTYRWKGELEDETEILLLIKTTRDREDGLRAMLADVHPYELPELIFVPITGGSAEYLRWLRTSA